MNYTHLTQDERYQIAVLKKAGHEQSDIAQLMNRSASTISRELRRNRGQRGYRAKQAHEFSQARMRACENGPRVSAQTWAFVATKLAETWSPEQIAGHLKLKAEPTGVDVLENEFFLCRCATDEIHGERTCKFAQLLRRSWQRVVGDDRQQRAKDFFRMIPASSGGLIHL